MKRLLDAPHRIACFATWAWRYVPYYWRPRADGKPG